MQLGKHGLEYFTVRPAAWPRIQHSAGKGKLIHFRITVLQNESKQIIAKRYAFQQNGVEFKTIVFIPFETSSYRSLCRSFLPRHIAVPFWAIDHNTTVPSHSKWHWQTTNSSRIRSLMDVSVRKLIPTKKCTSPIKTLITQRRYQTTYNPRDQERLFVLVNLLVFS